jgi:lysyl-tRNA synthetase class 2
MHPVAGGAAARPFVTHHNALDLPLYLRVAPELYLKRLVVGGMEAVYEVNRNFRNEGVDSRHNPEFTMLELYRAWWTWRDLLALTEELLATVAERVTGGLDLPFGEATISFRPPFRKATMEALVAEATGLSGPATRDVAALARAWGDRPLRGDAPNDVGGWWELLFGELVEPTLIQPTFVMGFPTSISPLARRSDDDPDLAERFELFAAGMEIANGFSELNDPVDQASRFAAQAAKRTRGDADAMDFDVDYVRALCSGMPPTAGEGIGIDRLVMLLTGRTSIRDVILFPLLRPEAG